MPVSNAGKADWLKTFDPTDFRRPALRTTRAAGVPLDESTVGPTGVWHKPSDPIAMEQTTKGSLLILLDLFGVQACALVTAAVFYVFTQHPVATASAAVISYGVAHLIAERLREGRPGSPDLIGDLAQAVEVHIECPPTTSTQVWSGRDFATMTVSRDERWIVLDGMRCRYVIRASEVIKVTGPGPTMIFCRVYGITFAIGIRPASLASHFRIKAKHRDDQLLHDLITDSLGLID